MKILFINSAKEWGGNEKWCVAAASGLAARGHDVWFGIRSKKISDRILSEKVKKVKFPFVNNADILSAIGVWLFCRKCGIEILVPSKQREYFLAGAAGKMLVGTKVVFRFGIDRPLHTARNRVSFCWFADAVLVNSRAVIHALAQTRRFDTDKCRLMYNGVALPAPGSPARQEYRAVCGAGNDDILIVCIGRISRQKRFDLALHAFSLLAEKTDAARLAIIGGGDELNSLQALAQNHQHASRISITGFVENVSFWLQASDIFWLTSESEGMANAMLEAMAHAKPVVAFDIAGVSDIIVNDENGVVVPFGDCEAIAQKSVELMQDSSRCTGLAR
ncbi:MAG: glycosyltransferase, partial [Chitinivibrionales bacterium]|nr:glycosyltransferase [Chitinivibrionales bacterium]